MKIAEMAVRVAPKTIHFRSGHAALFATLLTVTSCGDGTAPPTPATVVVSPSNMVGQTVGETIQYDAQVLDNTGTAIPGAKVLWTSGAEAVAEISASGLATVTGPGRTAIRASHETVSGSASLNVELEPAGLKTVAGDSQTAPALSVLLQDPIVQVEDAGGTPIQGVQVAFEVISGGGQIAPRTGTTDASGQARTRWTLGEDVGIQVLRAAVGGTLQVDFTVTATDPLLAVRTSTLDRARISVPYREALEVIGGTAPWTWSLASGSLPSGLELHPEGAILGTAADSGTSTFIVRVRDAAGLEATEELSLQVCEAPIQLESGGVKAMSPVQGFTCPPFIPAGNAGDRYRIGVVRTEVSTSFFPAAAVVKITEKGRASAMRATSLGIRTVRDLRSSPGLGVPRATSASLGAQMGPILELEEGLRRADRTARFHEELQSQARRLLRELGPEAILPDLGNAAGDARIAADQHPPPDRILVRPYDSSRSGEACQAPAPDAVPALLVAYSDDLAIYQDSVQQAIDPIDTDDTTQVLDYYDAYGARTIEEYFGGVSDMNGDGRITVFVSPVVSEGIAAFVWAGDFFNVSRCFWSNEMELIYFNESMFDAVGGAPQDGHYQALPTMVHEVKHVSSLYKRLKSQGFQPSWIEEGSAEIAAEISSRMAMEAVGGVAQGALLNRDAYPPRSGLIITPENYGMLLRLARTILSYASPINSLSTNPSDEHTFYGTSWHFHRFLGDAYGDAGNKADGSFFSALNDPAMASAGIQGIQEVTGHALSVLLEQYAAAMMLVGTGAPGPERSFRTYDFPSATTDLFRPQHQPEGEYPWFHTGVAPVGFESATYTGDLAPAGIRFHDFESDGQGDGMEVEVSVTGGAARIVIVRVR